MSSRQKVTQPQAPKCDRLKWDHKLAAYLAATASGSFLVAEADAVVVSNSSVLPVGINGEANIDFNSDGQIDFQIDHDRVNLNGTNLDYLQIDKNDVNGALNPLDYDTYPGGGQSTFPIGSTVGDNDQQVLTFTNDFGDTGGYAVALKAGDVIGGSYATTTGSLTPGTIWDWQEGSNFHNTGTSIRANRLIDEDMGQIDQNAGRNVTVPFGQQPEFPEVDDFLGPAGATRYLGVRVDLNDAAEPGINENNAMENPDFHQHFWYGWIGIRITSDDDATAEVVGWGYQTEPGVSILAGETAAAVAGDYNGNGVVDAADYTIWRDHLGQMGGATPSQGDGTGDGNVTQADYDFWKTNFTGSGSGSLASLQGAAAVPEPSSVLLGLGMSLALIGTFIYRKLRN